MGFLDKLWDETLASPAPESGLGKLRKYNSFSGSRLPALPVPIDDLVPVSRTITVLQRNSIQIPNLNVSVDTCPIPSSPATPSTPATPQFPTTPGGTFKKLSRRKSTPATSPRGESRSPTGYDWIVLSALDC